MDPHLSSTLVEKISVSFRFVGGETLVSVSALQLRTGPPTH